MVSGMAEGVGGGGVGVAGWQAVRRIVMARRGIRIGFIVVDIGD